VKKESSHKKPKKGGSRAYRVIYAIFSGIVGFLFNIKVINKDREPDSGGYVVCANHVSATDPIALCYAFRKNQVHFMAKKELFKVPLLSRLIKVMGAFPVDRGGNDVGAVKNAIALVNDKKSMGIFPQGHRYPGEDPRNTKTKNGVALIATKTGADILPCYIWRKKNKFKLFRRTYVIIGEKIPFESLNYDPDANGEYMRITNIAFDKICALGEEFEAERKAKKEAKKGKKK
jgi:1-acyl-sn-glycerol-3-phosphate acyltransferase